MRFARGLLVFSYGLFTIAAQTLLFREFITTFEGNDISVGIFFGSWFLWVGLGAILVYRATAFARTLLRNIELLFLSYLPALVLQLILILHARELAGVESYALLPVRTILLLSIVLNAPLSIITGMLFPLACRWIKQTEGLAVSRVYILEATGSFMGGLGVTLLLGLGVSLARLFFILALIVSLSVSFIQLAKSRQYPGLRLKAQLAFLPPLCFLLCVVLGADKSLMRYVRVIKWTKLLPAKALIGSFQTAQAEYLYGVYQGQWVAVREGSTCEALPDRESAGRIAAIGLCQNPHAERILVIGSGLGLCREFLRLPQIEHLTWTHCDSDYVQELGRFIPAEFRISDERFHKLAGDVRPLFTERKQYYDLVILNLPDATSSVLNRYYTLEFYHQVKESLRTNGVLALRIAGGENIMGTELINLGASTKLTLEKAFSQLALVPGEDTWFIASDSEQLTGDPGTLRDRFAAISGGADILPPDALLSVYLPDRADAALVNYKTADLPEVLLINRDARPLTHLYSLLLTAKQSGAPVARFIKHLALAGPLAFLVPLLVLVVLRITYLLKSERQGGPSSFDSTFLVFSAGWIGIGVVIVLMYLYQTRFGSLYLHIGIISSLFMVGLTGGAVLISALLAPDRKLHLETLLFPVVLTHAFILVSIVYWPAEGWTHPAFAFAFIFCGLCTGCYFPLAARQLADSAFETGQSGSKLETADHLGASAGGVVTSLAVVPVLGTKATLFLFVLFILTNVPLAALRVYKPREFFSIATAGFSPRRLGYALFGIGLSVVVCSNLLAYAGARLSPSLPHYAAQALAGESQIEQDSAAIGDKSVKYFNVYQAPETDPNASSPPLEIQELVGYIFSSQDLAPEIRGFGGRINLGVYVDTTGKLIDFHVIRSNETPAYLELLAQWQDEKVKGRRLFEPEPFAGVDAVSGATVSAEAVLEALRSSGYKFAAQILGRTLQTGVAEESRQAAYLPNITAIYLVGAFALTLIVIYYGGFWSRLAVLALNLVAGGIILNAQYSSEQMSTILSLHAPAIALSGAFLLAIGVLLLVVIFGNIYCGYICPFGAAQELLGYVLPRRFKLPVSREKMQRARFVKYVILFVLIILFFTSRSRTTLAVDPLISIFSLRFTLHNLGSAMLWMVVIALVGSIFYTRFWCRYLCPAGAFLSLFNNAALLRRFLPPKKFGRCEFGLTAKDNMDCIYCDKCRYEAAIVQKEREVPRPRYSVVSLLSRYLVVVVVIVAILVSAISVDRFLRVMPADIDYPAALAASGGQPRDVDIDLVRTMIRQGRLSDREAEFYKKVENVKTTTPAQE